jgi:tetratricopeptide (TPR) repeat protein
MLRLHVLRPAPLLLLAAISACGSRESGEPAAPAGAATQPPGPATIPVPTDPTASRSALEQGRAAAELGDLGAALAAYRKAVELDPTSAAAHFTLGSALMPSATLAVGGTAEKPEREERAVKLGVDRSVLEEGVQHLRRAAELEPGNADYAYWLGRGLHVADHGPEAIAALRRALELAPDHGLAHKRLGLLYLDAGEQDLARAEFTAARTLLPRDAGVPFQLGTLALETDPAAARASFEQAIAIDPTMPWAHHNLALALARLGDEAGAAREREAYETWKRFEAELSALVERAGKRTQDAAAQIEAGEHLFAAGREEAALGHFRRALRIHPEDPLAHLYCGIVLLRQADARAAAAHLERSVALAPDAVQPRVELARACAALGDEARLRALEGELARLVRPDDPDGELLLAQWLLERGRGAEAVPHFEAVLAALPGSDEARAGLERARGEGGR